MCASQDIGLITTPLHELPKVNDPTPQPEGPSPTVTILCMSRPPPQHHAHSCLCHTDANLSPEAPFISALPEDPCSSFHALPTQCDGSVIAHLVPASVGMLLRSQLHLALSTLPGTLSGKARVLLIFVSPALSAHSAQGAGTQWLGALPGGRGFCS